MFSTIFWLVTPCELPAQRVRILFSTLVPKRGKGGGGREEGRERWIKRGREGREGEGMKKEWIRGWMDESRDGGKDGGTDGVV